MKIDKKELYAKFSETEYFDYAMKVAHELQEDSDLSELGKCVIAVLATIEEFEIDKRYSPLL